MKVQPIVMCRHCGKEFRAVNSKSAFCSHNCSYTWTKKNTNQKQKDLREATQKTCKCGAPMGAMAKTCAKCRKGRPIVRPNRSKNMICKQCGKGFVSPTGKARCCSLLCHNKFIGSIDPSVIITVGRCVDCGCGISKYAIRCNPCGYKHKHLLRKSDSNVYTNLQRSINRMMRGEETEHDLHTIDAHDEMKADERKYKQFIKAEKILAKLGVASPKYFNCFRGAKR